jgi:hypothetical protein
MIEAILDPLGEIIRHCDVNFGRRLDRVLDGLPRTFTAYRKPVGLVENLLIRNDFLDTALDQLALDERDQLTAGHRVKLDALAAEQKFDFRIGRAVTLQPPANLAVTAMSYRSARRTLSNSAA